jgi:hypothetical protein
MDITAAARRTRKKRRRKLQVEDMKQRAGPEDLRQSMKFSAHAAPNAKYI